MSGTPQDIQDYTSVLKQVYLPVRRKAFPMSTPLLANAQRGGPDRVTYAGHDLLFAVKLDRRGGFVASPNGFTPSAKIAREKQGRLSISRTYATVSLDGLAIKAGAGDRASYIAPAKKAVEDVTEQWQLEQNRILHGDSLAIRGLCTSGAASATQTVDSPYGISSSGPGNLHLVIGEDIAFVSSTGATLRGKAQITNISLSGDTATLTLSTSITTTTGDHLVTAVPTAVDTNDTSWGAEPFGIKAFVDVEGSFGTFEQIKDDRWAAYNLTSSTVDELVLMRWLNTIRARSGVDWRADPKAFLLLTTTGIWQSYGSTMLGLRRFDAPQMTLKGGFTGVQVGNATLLDDPWAPRGRVYGIHFPSTVFIDLMDWGEIGFQDSPRWQRVSNRDAWEAVFASYWNYGLFMRNTMGCISSITDTVSYAPVF